MFSRVLFLLFAMAAGGVASSLVVSAQPAPIMLYDFTEEVGDDVSGWVEQSDTVRRVGMSLARLELQSTQVFRRAVLLLLLNPQPNGAGFAGVRHMRQLPDLTDYTQIQMKCRGQGEFSEFKMVLRHKDMNNEPAYTWEQTFEAPKTSLQVVTLPLDGFLPFYRGQQINSTETLDKQRITSIGLQMAGGVYNPTKQWGPHSLELDWIRAA